MQVHGFVVKGAVDGESRCRHYHGASDIVAVKFYCCKAYFPCHPCHDELGCGRRAVWPQDRWGEKAVLCGACGEELTIHQYLTSRHACPACGASFNPRCSLHHHLYFAV